MTTAAALLATDLPTLKPSRSMPHHLRDPRARTGRSGKGRPKHGEPFDPEDLTRRLTAVIEDQKSKAERRRANRASRVVADQPNSMYHHVPKVAAAAFERTTTPDVLRQIHKLAQPAARTHFDALHTEIPQLGYAATLLQQTQAIDQATVEREIVRSRNQFQWSPEMEEAAETDVGRDLYKPPQRTFHTETTHLSYRLPLNATRPLSADVVFSEDEEMPVVAKSKTRPAFGEKDRNDWAQHDDLDSRQHKKEWARPFLRRKDSLWIIMRVKREKGVRRDKDDGTAGNGNQGSPPDINKGGKARFLDRFKRHSS